MEMDWSYNADGNLERITFQGLSGSEFTGNLKSALQLLKVKNPTSTFADRVKTGEFDNVTDDEYERLVGEINFISTLWRYPDAQEGELAQYELNVLMLLANAIAAASRMHAIISSQDAGRKEREDGERMIESWVQAKK